MSWTVYILELNDNSLYTGITNNIEKRLNAHRSGKGSKYVRSRLPFDIVYQENAECRSSASKREAQIKRFSQKRKLKLIRSMNMSFPIEPLLDRVFVKKDEMDAVIMSDGIEISLPEVVKGRAKTGLVVAAGPGYLDIKTGEFWPMTVKVGDRVYLKEFDGYIFTIDKQDYFVFREAEILGRVTGDL